MVVFLGLRSLHQSCAWLCSSPILGALLCESCFVSAMKVLEDFVIFSYWGCISQLEVRSERYGFSKVDHQLIMWRKKEIMTFGFIIGSFYLFMGIAKQLPTLVS